MKRRTLEDDLQIAIVRWLRLVAPGLTFFHVPNGGKRGIAEAKRFKAMGVLAGVADLVFILDGGRIAFIELKVGRNQLEAPQETFRESVQQQGCPYAVCRSLDEVEGTLRGWGVTIRGRIAA